MPKGIDVTLQQIFCDTNGFGGSVMLTGNIFGARFQNDPNNPNDERDRTEIFPFPAGPISISQGQAVAVTMQPATFFLSTPSTEPATLNPKFLRFGGELNNGLGSNFIAIDNLEPLPFTGNQAPGDPPVQPRQFDLRFSSPNLSITLTFGLIVTQVF
jgi:hypothetical protein